MSGLDVRQLRDLIVHPTLAYLGLPGGEVAERLIMGTAAHESTGFRHIRQVGGGPALGLWQMEPRTFADLWDRYLLKSNHEALKLRIHNLCAPWPKPVDQLVGNLAFACAMARTLYYSRPFKMPETAAAGELALIYKSHYNSSAGKGRPLDFMRAYREYIAPLYPGT